MKLSAKWSTISLFFATALGAAAVAFSGCTVTSGTVDDDGGTVRDGSTSNGDGGSEASAEGGGDAAAPTCEGNTQQNQLVSAECQSCLEQNCCNELKGCFNEQVPQGDVDCQAYADCIANCLTGDAGDPQACFAECDAATDQKIISAYDAIITCAEGNATCKTACGIQ